MPGHQSWKDPYLSPPANPPSLYKQPYDGNLNSILYQWGPLQWTVQPFNTNAVDHESSTDWAHKEIAGAAIYREWVGENDEILYMRGLLFPYRVGGFMELYVLEGMRRQGIVSMMVRGDGEILGWFALEKLVRAHEEFSAEGVGQQIHFEAVFARLPVPAAEQYFNSYWRTVGAGYASG
jgi:hypothetical protein